MPLIDNIICLANSKKHSGRCIAGKTRLANGTWAWVRPVGVTSSKEITEADRQYGDGSRAQVLDVIGIQIQGKDAHPYQKENVVIDNGHYWIKRGSFPQTDLQSLTDAPTTLWENGNSTIHGINDRVSGSLLSQHRDTLFFIAVGDVEISVAAEGSNYGNNKLSARAAFTYNGVRYALKITDPELEQRYIARGAGNHDAPELGYFTVSLSEPFNGDAYKLIAAAF
jgi:hypothetical protein